jgi:hypothetical protein
MVASSRDADMAKVSHTAPEPPLITPFTPRSRALTVFASHTRGAPAQ